MTADEAFIRAIVDDPGDDTSRLVYADWLDDRADPCGPYLRAEMEWAKTRRNNMRPAESGELRTLAAELEPVWVARVSRPPVGVCCDHIGWYHEHNPEWYGTAGRPLTPVDVERCENQLGAAFPPEFRAWLLNCNGCSLMGTNFPRVMRMTGPISGGEAMREDYRWVEWFHTVWHHNQPAAQFVDSTVEARGLGLPADRFCIAFVPEDDEVILSSTGRVHLWPAVTDGYDENNLIILAESLGWFLSSLTVIPDSED